MKMALEEAVDTYSASVYRLSLTYMRNRADAEDVYGEVFLRLVENYNSLTDDEHIKRWIFTVTVNTAKSMLSSARRKKNVPLDENISSQFSDGELEVYDAVSRLPEKYKTVIHLFYYEDLPTQDIAKILNTNEATIRTRLNRARKLLSDMLK